MSGGHLPSKFKEVAIVGQAMVIRLMFLYYCYKHDLKPVFPVAVPLQRIWHDSVTFISTFLQQTSPRASLQGAAIWQLQWYLSTAIAICCESHLR